MRSSGHSQPELHGCMPRAMHRELTTALLAARQRAAAQRIHNQDKVPVVEGSGPDARRARRVPLKSRVANE